MATPGLLISVRNDVEARLVLRHPVEIIDVKEPARGSLGMATTDMICRVAEVVSGARPLSVAGGELLGFDPAIIEQLPNMQYFKLGLSGCRHEPRWQSLWADATKCLARSVTPVAVAYADAHLAMSPTWQQVIEVGRDLGCRVLLVDTFDKQHGLCHYLDIAELSRIGHAARRSKMRFAVAGSLRIADLASVTQCCPNWVAVRGAVCGSHRRSDISDDAVGQLIAAMD